MFGRIARRYDLMNRLLSLGIDGGWRRFSAKQARLRARRQGARHRQRHRRPRVRAGEERRAATGSVIGLDITHEMLVLGGAEGDASAARPPRRPPRGRRHALPYADNVFRATTMAFGGRNVPDLTGAFREMSRVMRRAAASSSWS